jgi:glycosyltransferase involved in cell wall biosynthesis
MPTVSVIVPFYNEEKTIELFLDAVYGQTCRVWKMEIVLANGNSSDHSVEKILQWQKEHPDLQIKIIENPKRIIPSGLNLAIQHASGEFIIRLDAHCIPAENYVELSINALKADKGANVGGRWDIQPGSKSGIARAIAKAASSPFGVGDAKYRYSEEASYVDTVPFGAYRKSTLLELGGFDESLLTNEDYDLNVRLRRNGKKIWFDPKIRCTYFARSSLTALAKQYWRYGYWKMRMLRKDPRSLRLRQLIPPLFVFSIPMLLIGQLFFSFFATVISLELIAYIMGLTLIAIRAAGDENDLALFWGMPVAISVMHFCWGSGFLWSLLTLSRKRKS